ncbi:MAG TPA: hypothetical protein VFC69_04770 [Dysgonamonadaceae bacterium]|nr:hypothetical protein [Dysgonamonadaceae bacterium]
MKKLILFAAILFAGVSVVKAQVEKKPTEFVDHLSSEIVTNGSDHSEATTNLKVVLNTIQSISVNTSEITLEYKDVLDYQDGVNTGFIDNHLKVYSTGAYDVQVNFSDAGDGSYVNSTDGYTADAMFESITIALQKNTLGDNATLTGKSLEKTAGNSIISSTKGEFGATYDVDYIGGTDYINSIKDGTKRTYTATVNYAIIAK